jgi:hypothetical protein
MKIENYFLQVMSKEVFLAFSLAILLLVTIEKHGFLIGVAEFVILLISDILLANA